MDTNECTNHFEDDNDDPESTNPFKDVDDDPEIQNSFKDVNDDSASRLYDSPVLMNSNESTKQFEEEDDDPPWLYNSPWNDGRNPSLRKNL